MQRTTYRTWTLFAAVFVAFLFIVLTASEARSASLVTDNATPRFSASKAWVKSDWSPERFGANYRVLKRPSANAAAARWMVDVPGRGSYDVFARWPSDPGYNAQATFRIETTDGAKFKTVNQRQNGGTWVKLGQFDLKAGDSYKVALLGKSAGAGFIVADAVKIAKPGATTDSGGGDSGGGVTGADIVRETRTWLGVPYKYGGADRNGVDCSGLTMRVYEKFGISIPRTTSTQWGAGKQVSSPAPGDLVFFGSGPNNISSVGIYTGPDEAIKATVPGENVRYVSISGVKNAVGGWVGYRRLI